MKDYYFGVDVGGTTIKMGLYSQKSGWVKKWEIPTRKENGGMYVLDDIAAAVYAAQQEFDLDNTRTAGIGIGVPGPVLKKSIVNGCVNVGWDVVNVSEELGKRTGLPVYVENDANIAALGEQWKGAGKDYQSVALLTLGTGVGGGVTARLFPVFRAAAEKLAICRWYGMLCEAAIAERLTVSSWQALRPAC